MNFSDKLKLLRKEQHLDQKQASEKIGIALSTLRKYEQVGKPDVPQLIKIKEYFNVSYDYLLNDKCETRNVSNLEIVNSLGITEETVNAIRKTERKQFLEDLLTNKNKDTVLILLEEKAETQFTREYAINRFCKRLYKTKNYNLTADTTTNTMQALIDYMKKKKIEQDYWNYTVENKKHYKSFMNSLKYIMVSWKNGEKIQEDAEELKGFNNEIFDKISNDLKSYEKYCFFNFPETMEEFCKEYTTDKVFKL